VARVRRAIDAEADRRRERQSRPSGAGLIRYTANADVATVTVTAMTGVAFVLLTPSVWGLD